MTFLLSLFLLTSRVFPVTLWRGSPPGRIHQWPSVGLRGPVRAPSFDTPGGAVRHTWPGKRTVGT